MINDSAGIEVPLIDKSERASTAIGFRSAAVIEAARGLCETPALIASEKDFVKVFGAPAADKYGAASMEAYFLAQRQVPQVITRAKNTELDENAKVFSVLRASASETKLDLDGSGTATAIVKPSEGSAASIYFKGEGDYATASKKNVVLRVSKPVEESAYADEKRVMRLQVFDFAGASHIDENKIGKLLFNPMLCEAVGADGSLDPILSLMGAADGASVQLVDYTVTAYVNGRKGVCKASDGSGAGADGLWGAITTAINNATTREGGEVIPSGSWELKPSTTAGNTDKYIETKADGKINAFNLSVSIAISADAIVRDSGITTSFYSDVDAGTVAVSSTGDARVVLSTSAILSNRSDYMFMGEFNADWAAYYEGYLKESWDLSFSYNDFDANYVSMQADAVLKASDYLVCKSSENGIDDYAITWDADDPSKIDPFVTGLIYFTGVVASNDISTASKSYAYGQALSLLLLDNVTRWRCLVTPNLGDIMTPGDYNAAIDAAGESTLGISNIGRAASVDALNNLGGRHGNRFIADYSVYGYRNINGRRTPLTLACLMTDRLNANYNNGNEARPPFGYTYGQIACDEISQNMNGPQRLMLARQYKVNPVNEDGGFFAWDERTSQLKETSLSDIHNILSFVIMKFAIYDSMKSFIAEYNDEETVARGLSILEGLRLTFISKKYCQEAAVDADTNVIGDETLRFRFHVRFKGAARYIVVEITAYSQTQALAISMAQEA